MASFTLQTRNHGEIRFNCRTNADHPEWAHYVVVYAPQLGYEHKQPTDGHGSTLTATEATLERVARRWWRGQLAAYREYGYEPTAA